MENGICEKCGKNPQYWSATWCESCLWELVKGDEKLAERIEITPFGGNTLRNDYWKNT